MSEDVKLNMELAQRWAKYFEAANELELVYKELLSESLAAKSKGEEIPGMIIVKPGAKTDDKAAVEYATQRGWTIPYYQPEPKVNMDELKKLFEVNKVKIPKKETAASAREKK